MRPSIADGHGSADVARTVARSQPARGRARGPAWNTAILVLVQVLGRLQGLVFVPLITRQLGSADLAAYQLGNILVGYFSIVVLFGLSPLMVRAMAQNPSSIPRMFIHSLETRMLFATVSLAALTIMLATLDYPQAVNTITLILGTTLFATAIADAADSVFQATERMYYSVIVTGFTTAVYIPLGWLALSSGMGVVGLAVANSLSVFGRSFFTLAIIHSKFFPLAFTWDIRTQRQLITTALPFFLGSASSYLLSKVDIFILSRMVSLELLGFYVAGYFFLDVALFVPNAFQRAIYPSLARSAARMTTSLQEMTQRFFEIILAVMLLIVVLTMPVADGVIHIVYGRGLDPAIPVLQILVWGMVVYAYNATVGAAIYAAGGQWALVAINAIAAASNIGLNVVLIPAYGIIGASIATVATFGVGSVLHAFCARRYRCAVTFSPILRASPGVVLGVAAGMLLARWSELAAIVGGPVVYGSGLLVARYVPVAVWRHPRRFIQKAGEDAVGEGATAAPPATRANNPPKPGHD